jgi:hypothetical protein
MIDFPESLQAELYDDPREGIGAAVWCIVSALIMVGICIGVPVGMWLG